MDQVLLILLGGIITLVVAHLYYKQATKDLKKEVTKLQDFNDSIQKLLVSLDEIVNWIYEDASITKEHVVKGTPDDPDYPYK